MSNRPARDTSQFKPCHPPRVVRDYTLGGQPVLLLGWWLDAYGKAVEVEVATFTSHRRTHDIAAFPEPPAEALPNAPGAFVREVPADA